MKRKRFAVEQITAMLKQVDLGTPAAQVCRQYGVSEQSLYRWKKRYGGALVRLRKMRVHDDVDRMSCYASAICQSTCLERA